jgi:hypothetical protein
MCPLRGAVHFYHSPAAAGYVIALIVTIPRELNEGPARPLGIPAIGGSHNGNELELARFVFAEADVRGAKQAQVSNVPGVYFNDSPVPRKSYRFHFAIPGSTTCKFLRVSISLVRRYFSFDRTFLVSISRSTDRTSIGGFLCY